MPTRPINVPPPKKATIDDDCMYQKGADSPEPQRKVEESSDEDELDKFMAGVEVKYFIHQFLIVYTF